MLKEESKLKPLDERGLVTTAFGQYYLTRHENKAYIVFAYEVKDEIHVNFMRKEPMYPEIHAYGVEVSTKDTLNAKELNDHIEILTIAKETYEQVIEMYKDIRIRQFY